MRSIHKEIWLEIPSRMEFVNITHQVQKVLHESEIQEGLCLVNAMHITASVFINDDEYLIVSFPNSASNLELGYPNLPSISNVNPFISLPPSQSSTIPSFNTLITIANSS